MDDKVKSRREARPAVPPRIVGFLNDYKLVVVKADALGRRPERAPGRNRWGRPHPWERAESWKGIGLPDVRPHCIHPDVAPLRRVSTLAGELLREFANIRMTLGAASTQAPAAASERLAKRDNRRR